jgi:chromosome segregation ATPase
MSRSLHLSDVSSVFGTALTGLSSKQRSLRQVVQSYKPKLDRIETRPAQLDRFATELSMVKGQIALEKTALSRQLSETMDACESEEFEIQQEIRQVSERRDQVTSQHLKHSESVARLKQQILELKAEDSRILKRIEWAESILQSDVQTDALNELRNDVLKAVDELEQEKEEIRQARSRVFSLQKQFVDISEVMAPLRIRQVLLRSRLQGAELDNSLSDPRNMLREHFLSTKQVAVGAQQLAVEKLKLQRQLNAVQQRIEEARAQKAELMQSILPLRAHDDAALKAVWTQIEQYQMAAARSQKVFNSSRTSKQDSISHELDLKMERDKISRELAAIDTQMKAAEAELNSRQAEIDSLKLWLQENPLLSEVAVQSVVEDSLLTELIKKIQWERDLEIQLSKPAALVSPAVCDDFSEELKRKGELRMRKIAAAIQLVQEESREIQAQIDQCEQQFAQAEAARRRVIPSPRAKRYQSQVAGLQESVDAQQKKCEKKRRKVSEQNHRLKQLLGQLEPEKNHSFLRSELCARVDRSANWLLPNIRKEKKAWSESVAQSALGQLATEWDAKILNAALNEADDLASSNKS